VLELFQDRDFHYRTYRPDLLCEQQIDDLVGTNDLCCIHNGRLIGLFAADPLPAGFPGHHQIHMRFAPWFADETASRVVAGLIRGLADHTPVRRLTHLVAGFDTRGQRLAAAAGFRDEGTLSGLIEEHGRRWPVHYFALLIGSYPVESISPGGAA
jgi:hypothetical protein